MEEAASKVGKEKVKMLYLETPANPSNVLIDISEVSTLAEELSKSQKFKVFTAVDNTLVGPVFLRPGVARFCWHHGWQFSLTNQWSQSCR